jgi:hypothetical protein
VACSVLPTLIASYLGISSLPFLLFYLQFLAGTSAACCKRIVAAAHDRRHIRGVVRHRVHRYGQRGVHLSGVIAMNAEAIRRIHDAALELGAECHEECPFWLPAEASKSHTVDRARALLLLSTLN